MKTVKNTITPLLLLLVSIMMACKKEPGMEGKKVVRGAVLFKNGGSGLNEPAAGAVVYVTFGAAASTGTYDHSTTANAEGNYTIRGLQKGDYFITAEFTDSHGFKYTTPGYVVTIKTKSNDLVLDILLE